MGERKYYLSNLDADTTIKQLAGAIKARWVCELAHQQLKEKLGLQRHALMPMIALTFLQLTDGHSICNAGFCHLRFRQIFLIFNGGVFQDRGHTVAAFPSPGHASGG